MASIGLSKELTCPRCGPRCCFVSYVPLDCRRFRRLDRVAAPWPVTAYHRSALPDRVRAGTCSEWTPDETQRRAHRHNLTPLTFTWRALESASLLSGIFVHAAYTISRDAILMHCRLAKSPMRGIPCESSARVRRYRAALNRLAEQFSTPNVDPDRGGVALIGSTTISPCIS
jgi:hypothetical protein